MVMNPQRSWVAKWQRVGKLFFVQIGFANRIDMSGGVSFELTKALRKHSVVVPRGVRN